MLVLGVGVFELVDSVGQRLGDKTASVNTEVASGIRLLVSGHSASMEGSACVSSLGLPCKVLELLVGGPNGRDKLIDFFGVFEALVPWA